MKTTIGSFRNAAYLFALFVLSAAFSACGGGGTASNSPGSVSGMAAASLSFAASPAYPDGTVFAPASAAPAVAAPPAPVTFDNVFVTVTRIALIPSDGPGYPDPNGELEATDTPAEDTASGMSGFVNIDLPAPVVIDLLHLPTAKQVAKAFNKFGEVPAGQYSKIRVYYSKVEGRTSDGTLVPFHRTAHYHFDVHFVGGDLVVPIASAPHDGIRFYAIDINVVELKIVQAGSSGNFLLRPQVFATVAPPELLVSGVAQDVLLPDRSFSILTAGGRIVPVAYGPDTVWLYVDNTTGRSSTLAVADTPLGDQGLRDTALVDAIGSFSTDGVLQPGEVDVTFPASLSGDVYLGWNPPDATTFQLRLPAGDNTVVPVPTRETAFYDNAVSYEPLTDSAIVDNAGILARGYAIADGIKAYWISVGP